MLESLQSSCSIVLRGDLPRLGRCTHIMTSSTTSNTRRSKPLKYAYEKEIVLYAHHRQLDYFSTECLYSPEAFRGSARTLIKDLEKSRASTILDIVRSGEEMSALVPQETNKDILAQLEDSNDTTTGCGSAVSRLGLSHDTNAIKNAVFMVQTASLNMQAIGPETISQQSMRRAKQDRSLELTGARSQGRKAKTQTFGSCHRCGYLSSQSICKACVLLETLNKARPQMEVAIDSDPAHLTKPLLLAKLQNLGIHELEI